MISHIGKHLKDFEEFVINILSVLKNCKSSKYVSQSKIRWFNDSTSAFFTLDDRLQNEHADVSIVYAQVSHENTKRGPNTNKNISVRNINAQIANMSSNESAGFKIEYQVNN